MQVAMTLMAQVALVSVLFSCGAPPRGAPLYLSLSSIDGGETNLTELRGRVVVLHIFAAWSLAAQADVPQLVALARDEPRAVVVGIGVDPEGRVVLAPWRDANSVRYLIVSADERLRTGGSTLGRIVQVPTTIVLDAAGRVVTRIERPLAEGELAELVRREFQDRLD